MKKRKNNILKIGNIELDIDSNQLNKNNLHYLSTLIGIYEEYPNEFNSNKQRLKYFDLIFPYMRNLFNENNRLKQELKLKNICYNELVEVIPDLIVGEFDNNKPSEKLLLVISRYRRFIMQYLNITRLEILVEISKRWDKPVYLCHLDRLNKNEATQLLDILHSWKKELTGSYQLPLTGNICNYVKLVKEKQFKENQKKLIKELECKNEGC